MLMQQTVRDRTTSPLPHTPTYERPVLRPHARPHEESGRTGLKGLWRYMTTAKPRNRWVALWRTDLPCEASCAAPATGLGYLELDADLTVRGAPELYTCAHCGKRFVVVAQTTH